MDKDWVRFECTGNVKDYLSYKASDVDFSSKQERDEINERDHLAHRDGAGSDTHRGL